MGYSDDSKELVRERSPLSEIAGKYTELRRSGPDALVGRCPLHDDRTPSFTISVSKELFHCFGCDAKGDVFTFVMQRLGLDFVGALEHLAARAGIELERDDEGEAQRARRQRRTRLLEVIDRAARFYAQHLHAPSGHRALAYLRFRGLQDDVLQRFAVGFAPPGRSALITSAARAGIAVDELLAADLAVRRNHSRTVSDRFCERIMFPVADWQGRIVGFGARRLGEHGPKYVNSRQGPLYRKAELLYGCHQARPAAAHAGLVVVVEGYTDVLAFHQAAAANTVAAMGTAVGEQQIALLKRMAPAVVFVMDGDKGGVDAALRAGALASAAELDVRVALLADATDPADLASDGGREAVAQLLQGAVSFARFQLATAIDRADLSSAEGKDALLGAARPIVHGVRPGAVREMLVAQLAAALGFRAATVDSWLGEELSPTSPASCNADAAAGEWRRLRQALAEPALRSALDAEAFDDPVRRRAAALIAGERGDLASAVPDHDRELARVMTLLLTA